MNPTDWIIEVRYMGERGRVHRRRIAVAAGIDRTGEAEKSIAEDMALKMITWGEVRDSRGRKLPIRLDQRRDQIIDLKMYQRHQGPKQRPAPPPPSWRDFVGVTA